MADDNGFPNIHIDFIANGDFVHLRTNSGGEMAEVIDGFEQNAEGIFKGIGNIKQASLVSGVFSGNAQSQSSGGGSAPAAPRAAANTPPGEKPECPTHKGSKDMRGKRNAKGEPYKYRYYCTKFGCTDFKGAGEWVE